MIKRREVERVMMAGGVILLTIYAASRIDGLIASHTATRAFDNATKAVKEDAVQGSRKPVPRLEVVDQVNTSGWAPERAAAYAASLLKMHGTPMGMLGLSKLNLRVPVFEGTSGLILNRGAGWIPGTARPGEQGNIGIAGHRDGFFRGLKDYRVGDLIELARLDGTDVYSVDQIEIVDPEDVQVLRPRARPSITLVTCYPFNYVGDAPKRFIVHAARQGSPAYQ
jgi:sortase A